MYEPILSKPKSFFETYKEKTGDQTITHYCPGCGHGIVHKYVASALDELNLTDRAIFVSPVGCSVFGYYYFNTGNLQAAHGRAPAVATGSKRVNPDSIVISYQGDGDLAAIGTAEIIHAANRGELITVIFINNAIYGMTGGQMAPTTLVGQKTTTTPRGRDPHNEGYPVKMCELISQLNAPIYVERVALNNAANRAKAKRAIKKALKLQSERKGFTFVEVLSQCPTGWKVDAPDALKWIEEKMIPYYPVKVFKDTSNEAEPYPEAKEIISGEKVFEILGIKRDEKKEETIKYEIPEKYKNPRIKIAGFGGQGVLLLGVALAQVGMMEGYNVTWIPSYGPEMRGGTANCSVNISDSLIGSPVVEKPTILVAMNKPSMEKFEKDMVSGGILFYNTAMIDTEPQRDDIIKVPVPATKIASDLGNIRVGNMVMLGAIIEKTKLLPLETVKSGFEYFISRKNLIPLNEKAVEAGMNYIKENNL